MSDFFPMPVLATYTVRRAGRALDPYSGQETTPDWTHATEREVQGFLAHDSGFESAIDAGRLLAESDATLTIPDPSADVQRGDMIIDGPRKWIVQGFPSNDVNPFTGWQPTLVASLSAWNG